MNLDLGSTVVSSDGQDVGRVDRIFFDTDRMTVRQFVVHKGLLLTEDRIVARRDVDYIEPDHTVHLKLTANEVHQLQPFVQTEHFPVFAGDYHHAEQPIIFTRQGSAPVDAVVLTHRSEVYDVDGKHIGHIDEINYDANGRATSFVVDAGFLFVHDVEVPVSAVKSITHDRIELSISAEKAEQAAI